ncbi:MAG: hypothetical protein GTO62_10820 [Planctomycetales bacterium]|nr:hypothetical protein [Planctomycetales bacterium]
MNILRNIVGVSISFFGSAIQWLGFVIAAESGKELIADVHKRALKNASPRRDKWTVLPVFAAAVFWCAASLGQQPPDTSWLKAKGYYQDVPIAQFPAAAIDLAEVPHLQNVDLLCGSPDHASPELAAADPAVLAAALGFSLDTCRDIVQMHATLLAAQGAGSWPRGCHAHHPNHHSATYYVDRKSFPDHFKREVTHAEWQDVIAAAVWGVNTVEESKRRFSYRSEQHAAAAREAGFSRAQVGGPCNLLDTALQLMAESLRRVGCAHVEVFDGPDGDHRIHIRAKPIPGSVIGYAFFNDGTCRDHVNQFIDSTWRPGLHRLALLLLHETGHNNNLQHTFANQQSHRGIMSYSWDPPIQGFSTGQAPFRNPRDPSLGPLARFYDLQPVPIGDPKPPPKPGPATITLRMGDPVTLTIGGKRVELAVKRIDGDTGPSLVQRVAAALAKVPDYPSKDQHRQALAMVYEATSQALGKGDITAAEAQQAIKTLRGLLLGRHADKWQPVFAEADAANSAEALLHVVAGLRGGDAIPDELVRVIRLIAELLPEGNVRLIVRIILTVIDAFGQEAQAPEAGTDANAFSPALQK